MSERSATHAVQAAIDEAYAAPLEGWDFSWLESRAREIQPPWNYGRLVAEAARTAGRVLDIDTGGGEFLSRLAPFEAFVVATEGYVPNVDVAARTLARVGIPIVQIESAPDNVDQEGADPVSSRLPFALGAFDLVIDRHSSYWPSEVRRVLRPGGRFLTQQRSDAGVSGEAWEHLFDRPSPLPVFDSSFAADQLRRAGFEITDAEDADTPIVFTDLPGLIYYLRLVPWAVEGFDPGGDLEGLRTAAGMIATDGELRIRGSCMLLDATVPT
jgi:SAM-dependent methyltransferase